MATVSETPGRATSWRVSAPDPRPPEKSTTLSAPRAPLSEDTRMIMSLPQRAAEGVRPRLAADVDVAVDRAGHARRLRSTATDRSAEIRIMRTRCVGALQRRHPDVVDRRAVDGRDGIGAAVLDGQ